MQTSPWLVLAIVSSALFLIVIDMTILHTALPTLTRDLGATASEKLWIVNAYSLVVAGLLPGAGALGDRLGHRRMFLVGLVLFGVASVVAAFAPTADVLIASRALLAVGAASAMPATLSIIRECFVDPDQRAVAIGIWAAIASGGAALGPVVGGILLEHFFWGAVFLVNVPVVIVAIFLGAILVPRSRRQAAHPFDLVGSLLALLALGGGTLAVKQFATPAPSLSVAAVAAALGGWASYAFVSRQRRCYAPMIDFALFRDPRFAGGVIAAIAASAILLGLELVIMQRLQLISGLSPLQAGLAILPLGIAAFLAGPTAGVLLARTGTNRMIVVALIVMAAGVAGYWFSLERSALRSVSFLILGLGMGAAMTAASSAVMSNAPAERAGMAASIEEVSYELGGVFGLTLLGSILSGAYSWFFLSGGGAGFDQAATSIDRALIMAEQLPPAEANVLQERAAAAFDGAVGLAVAFSALILVVTATWIGVLSMRSGRAAQTPAGSRQGAAGNRS